MKKSMQVLLTEMKTCESSWHRLEIVLSYLAESSFHEECGHIAKMAIYEYGSGHRDDWLVDIIVILEENWVDYDMALRSEILSYILPSLPISKGHPGFVWYVDAAVNLGLYQHIYVYCIAGILFYGPDDQSRLQIAAYAVEQLSSEYWAGWPGARDYCAAEISKLLDEGRT